MVHISTPFFHKLWIHISLVHIDWVSPSVSNPDRPEWLFEYHHENVCKRTAKVGSVNIMTFLLWHVYFLTSRTECFYSWSSDLLTHSYRESMLPLTQNSWANAKSSFYIFFSHNGQSFGSNYESSMNKSINVGCLLIDGQISISRWKLPLVLELLILWWVLSEYHFECITNWRVRYL